MTSQEESVSLATATRSVDMATDTPAAEPAPLPSDAELEAIVREYMPAELRSDMYPRKGWQRIARWVFQWAWVGFLAYATYIAEQLVPPFLDGQPISGDTLVHALLLGRILPIFHDTPLLALAVPFTLLVLAILAGRWAYRDLKRERDVIAKQQQWIRHAVTEERSRMRAQAEAEAAVQTLEVQGKRIETLGEASVVLGATSVAQGEDILDIVSDTQQEMVDLRDTMGDMQEKVTVIAARDELPLTPVADLDFTSFKMGDDSAATFTYVKEPVKDIFAQATTTLRAVAEKRSAKQGILVKGEANAGKTRFVLEAIRAALPEWSLLVWSEAYLDNRLPSAGRLHGRDLIIFLDDLQNYASGGSSRGADGQALALAAGPAATLRALAQRVRGQDSANRVLFVATCRTENEGATEASLGWLWEKLEPFQIPTFDKRDDNPILIEFAQAGEIHRDEWDGTLGSLVLGLRRKREEYMALLQTHDPAASVLHAMKLLTICGIREHTERRVRAVCGLLGETAIAHEKKPWIEAVGTLNRLQFVTDTLLSNGSSYLLTIRKDSYFEYVVTPYPNDTELARCRIQLPNMLLALQDAVGLFYLANTLDDQQRYEEALTCYNEALRLDPTSVLALRNKADLLYDDLKRYDEALSAAQAATTLDPTSVRGWAILGDACRALGRMDDAKIAYVRAVSLPTNDALTWFNHGRALAGLERYSEAIDAFDQALALEPDDTDTWRYKAKSLRALGRVDEAQAAEARVSELEAGTAG